jgi:glycosyltransferase involved in cell wall biosynthesis
MNTYNETYIKNELHFNQFIFMGGKKSNKPKSIINGKYYPLVSVCTPTFNRRPFIPIMFECFRNQTYPKSRIEWIIVDDGTDKIQDLINTSNIPQIKYYSLPEKISLGEKRNYMHTKATGSIIVYMDDDDYYPPQRIEHAVDTLNENKDALCAGSSEIYIYFKHIRQMYQCGPYSESHATAGTFAFRAELLKHTRYDDHAALAEEKSFLKNYTVPFVQLDPMKTILVFSHNHNTFDKRKLLENQPSQFCKPSPKTVDMFIQNADEVNIKKFFMQDIDALLDKYEPGKPNMKPDVLKQIKEIEKEREKIVQEQMMKMNTQQQSQQIKIMMNTPDGKQVELNPQDIAKLLQQQQTKLDENANIISSQNNRIREMASELAQCNNKIKILEKAKNAALDELSKLKQTQPKGLESTSAAITMITPNSTIDSKDIIIEMSKSEPIYKLDISD